MSTVKWRSIQILGDDGEVVWESDIVATKPPTHGLALIELTSDGFAVISIKDEFVDPQPVDSPVEER